MAGGLNTKLFKAITNILASTLNAKAVGVDAQGNDCLIPMSLFTGLPPGRLCRAPQFLPAGTTQYLTGPTTTQILVACRGSGGGGGTAGNTAGQGAAGGGGGPGGFVAKLFAVQPSTLYTCAVASGGPSAQNGGTTSFTVGAVTINASGGFAGTNMGAGSAAATVNGGAPGGFGSSPASQWDYGFIGGNGDPGIRLSASVAIGGRGGDCPGGGGGGAATITSSAGGSGSPSGAGGGGGCCVSGAGGVAFAGGPGGDGSIIVLEFT